MKKQLFNDSWRVSAGIVGPFDMGAAPQEKEVTLPYDPMIYEERCKDEPGGGQTGFYPSKTYTFVKDFELPKKGTHDNVILEFEGVMSYAMVYVNGEFAGNHHHGYSQFFVDITNHLKPGKMNTVQVISQHQPLRSRWYSGAGIYRDVNLYTGGSAYIPPEGVQITTEQLYDTYAILRADITVRNRVFSDEALQLSFSVKDKEGLECACTSHDITVEGGKEAKARVRFIVPNPVCWSPDTPEMYTLKTSLTKEGILLDEAEDEFGIRMLTLDPVKGLMINGIPTKLRGGCIHHDNGLIGAASYYDAEVFRMQNMKDAGFNAIRSAHHPAGKALLRACDHVGILVMDELSDIWNYQKNANDYALFFDQEMLSEVQRMVSKDYNHPSVVLYSTGNEIPEIGRKSGRLMNRKIINAIHEADSTRFTTNAVNGLLLAGDAMQEFAKQLGGGMESASVGSIEEMNEVMGTFFDRLTKMLTESGIVEKRLKEISDECDVIGFNYMTEQHEAELKRNPQHVVVGSETYPEDIPSLWEIIKKNPGVIGDFTWTGYDYLGEAGIGIFHYDVEMSGFSRWPDRVAYCGDIDLNGFRRPVSYLREMSYGLRTAPYMFVERPEIFGKKADKNKWKYKDAVDSWTWNGFEGKPVRVYVLSCGNEVELFLNGEPMGKAKVGEKEPYTAVFELVYQPGELKAVSFRNGQKDGETILRTAGEVKQFTANVVHPVLKADRQSLSFIELELMDAAGIKNEQQIKPVAISVQGPGELLGYGSANPSEEGNSYQDTVQKSFNGRLMAVIRSTGKKGNIKVTFTADQAEPLTVKLKAE